MSAYVLYVEVEIAAGNEAACKAMMLKNAKAARETEPGCLQFDVLEDFNDPAIVRFYELLLRLDPSAAGGRWPRATRRYARTSRLPAAKKPTTSPGRRNGCKSWAAGLRCSIPCGT